MGGFVCTRTLSSIIRQLQETHSVELPATLHLLPDSLSVLYKSPKRRQQVPVLLAGCYVAPMDWYTCAQLTPHCVITPLNCYLSLSLFLSHCMATTHGLMDFTGLLDSLCVCVCLHMHLC